MSAAVKGQSTQAINSEDAESKFRANEARIKENLNDQEMKIREKLEERKKNSFIRSRSSAPVKKEPYHADASSQLEAPQTDSNGTSTRNLYIENILDELDPLAHHLTQPRIINPPRSPQRHFN